MKYSRKYIWQESKDYLGLLLGITIYAVGFTCFVLPYQITTGGLSGIAALIFYATGFPVQYTYLLVNCVLIIAAIKELGFRFCIKTIVGIAALTFMLGFLQEVIKDDQGKFPCILGDQAFMACVLGGCMQGIGLAIIFLNNGSTGGTDIIAAIVNKYKDITLGRMLMYCDIIIVSSCYFVFHDLQKVVFGFEIAEAINTKLDRGVTVLNGEGWYSKEPCHVLVVLAKKNEGINIFRLINHIDPNAFVSQSNVVGVYGEGFDRIKVK